VFSNYKVLANFVRKVELSLYQSSEARVQRSRPSLAREKFFSFVNQLKHSARSAIWVWENKNNGDGLAGVAPCGVSSEEQWVERARDLLARVECESLLSLA